MANKDSTLYAAVYTNKYISKAVDRGNRGFLFPIEHTVASDANGDTVNVCVIPAGWKIVALDLNYDALGASTTLSVGDAGSATRLLAATAVTTAGRVSGPSTTAGQNYVPTADTIILLTWGGATPTNAATVKGFITAIPPAG